MSKGYSDDPTKSNEEMVTEISTCDKHPFPVPQRLVKWLNGLSVLIREPRDPMNVEEKPTFGFPRGNEAVRGEAAWEQPIYDSIMWIRAISHDLDRLSNPEIEEADATHVRVIALALDRELLRLEALFEWAKTTWQYDPAIQAAAGSQPDPRPEESPRRKLKSCK